MSGGPAVPAASKVRAPRKLAGLRRQVPCVIAGTVAAIGILVMAVLASSADLSLAIVPFATSIALVAGAPESAPASTRAILLGHLLSAAIGIAVLNVLGDGTLLTALAVGLAVALMMALGAFHPPAAISPLIIVQTSPRWFYLVIPVLAGAVLVSLLAHISLAAHRHFDGQ